MPDGDLSAEHCRSGDRLLANRLVTMDKPLSIPRSARPSGVSDVLDKGRRGLAKPKIPSSSAPAPGRTSASSSIRVAVSVRSGTISPSGSRARRAEAHGGGKGRAQVWARWSASSCSLSPADPVRRHDVRAAASSCVPSVRYCRNVLDTAGRVCKSLGG